MKARTIILLNNLPNIDCWGMKTVCREIWTELVSRYVWQIDYIVKVVFHLTILLHTTHYLFIYHTEAATEWLSISWRHFQMHFLEWSYINVDYDVTGICSIWFNYQYSSIGSDNGLASARRQAISEPMMLILLTHICLARPPFDIQAHI